MYLLVTGRKSRHSIDTYSHTGIRKGNESHVRIPDWQPTITFIYNYT